MLMTNQTQQFKELVSHAKPESQIPKVEFTLFFEFYKFSITINNVLNTEHAPFLKLYKYSVQMKTY